MSETQKDHETKNVREYAFRALNYFENNPKHARDLFIKFCPNSLDHRDKALFREIIYGVLRWRNRLDWISEFYLNKSIGKLSHQVKQVFRIGVFQLVFLDKIPDYSAINTSVSLLDNTKDKWAKGLVNAVLRKVSSATPNPPENVLKDLSIWESHPEWIVNRWVRELGTEVAEKRCRYNNEIPNIVLRVNPEWGTVENLSNRLGAMGYNVNVGAFDPDCLHLDTSSKSGNLFLADNNLFREGAFWVQDEASSLVVRYANPTLNSRVWDCCAAPGGKTIGLFFSLGEGGEVYASDFSKSRINTIKINCIRMNVKANIFVADVLDKVFNKVFDFVLLDAPCSSLGVLRRHPDTRWRLEENKLSDFSTRQKLLLEAASKSVRSGGSLVYSVCSNEPEETHQVTSSFQSKDFFVNDNNSNMPICAGNFIKSDGSLQIKPEDGNIDGFYAMKWERKK
ncbi:MAG: 16S rRNA (cytosine(967)-C(5))-methyltransferase RsmB [Nitrospinota bacterium]|nr:16S rRNA (cytosine(967)-C(5))-methyltransferase RsmB [Nitrospinota bacterium]